METIKIIDLLNMIANGDKEIKDKYELKINTYLHCHYVPECLNDEVEIIEEDKKIKRLDLDWVDVFKFKEQVQQDCVKMIFEKINEIIDYINKENK